MSRSCLCVAALAIGMVGAKLVIWQERLLPANRKPKARIWAPRIDCKTVHGTRDVSGGDHAPANRAETHESDCKHFSFPLFLSFVFNPLIFLRGTVPPTFTRGRGRGSSIIRVVFNFVQQGFRFEVDNAEADHAEETVEGPNALHTDSHYGIVFTGAGQDKLGPSCRTRRRHRFAR